MSFLKASTCAVSILVLGACQHLGGGSLRISGGPETMPVPVADTGGKKQVDVVEAKLLPLRPGDWGPWGPNADATAMQGMVGGFPMPVDAVGTPLFNDVLTGCRAAHQLPPLPDPGEEKSLGVLGASILVTLGVKAAEIFIDAQIKKIDKKLKAYVARYTDTKSDSASVIPDDAGSPGFYGGTTAAPKLAFPCYRLVIVKYRKDDGATVTFDQLKTEVSSGKRKIGKGADDVQIILDFVGEFKLAGGAKALTTQGRWMRVAELLPKGKTVNVAAQLSVSSVVLADGVGKKVDVLSQALLPSENEITRDDLKHCDHVEFFYGQADTSEEPLKSALEGYKAHCRLPQDAKPDDQGNPPEPAKRIRYVKTPKPTLQPMVPWSLPGGVETANADMSLTVSAVGDQPWLLENLVKLFDASKDDIGGSLKDAAKGLIEPDEDEAVSE